LDEETEIKPAVRRLVAAEFEHGASIPVVTFPADSEAIQDAPRLALVIGDPEAEWNGGGQVPERVANWMRERGRSPRLYPASLIWCLKRPGRDLKDAVELLLAWRRVEREVAEGVLGAEFDRADIAEVRANVRNAEEAAKDEVWSGYRFIVLSDGTAPNGLKVIDLGAGHASASETLCGRVIAALKPEAFLNDSVGAGYIERHWPPAFKDSGAWPLSSLRQSFLNGTLTRLIDPDAVLRRKLLEFVERGDFGLAAGAAEGGKYNRAWYGEPVDPDEIAFDSSVLLLTKQCAQEIKTREAEPPPPPRPEPPKVEEAGPTPEPTPPAAAGKIRLRVSGTVLPELWNRLGTKVLTKLRSGEDLRVGIDLTVTVESAFAKNMETEIGQALDELGIADRMHIDRQ
jgi:hypothetical protein